MTLTGSPADASNLTLPGGDRILVAGGPQWGLPSTRTAEILDLSGEPSLTRAACHERTREYHSTALLLPDGRVLVAGSELEGFPNPLAGETMEVFYPPYLFLGPKPAVMAAPGNLSYGGTFTVEADPSVPVDRLALIQVGSVTHSINFDQRSIDLPFVSLDATALEVQAPADALEARPGWHMLVGLSEACVPWVAPIVPVGT